MAVRITVIDRTGEGRPPGTVLLEGKFSAEELKEKTLMAIGLMDFFGLYRIEVRDEKRQSTKKITRTCIIFVMMNEKPGGTLENPLDIFNDIFQKKWPRY